MPIILFLLMFFIFLPVNAQVKPGELFLLKKEDQSSIKILRKKEGGKKNKITTKPAKRSPASVIKKEQRLRKQLMDKFLPVKIPSPNQLRLPSSTEEEKEKANYLETLLVGNKKNLKAFLEYLHPDDPRRNIFEIDFYPFIAYVDNSSNSWFKESLSNNLGFGLGAIFWSNPQLGFSAKYGGTTGSNEKASPFDNSSIEALHEWFSIDIVYRKSYGVSLLSPRIWYKLGFHSYEHTVPADANYRVGSTRTGVNIASKGVLPLKENQHFSLEVALRPFQSVTEVNTGITVSSGELVNAYGLDLASRYEYYFRRKSSLYVELKYSYDKAVYRGVSSPSDPKTGSSLNGINIESRLILLSIGHKWGR